MAALSKDLRVRLVRAVEAGTSCRQVAARFEVSPSTVIKLMQRVRATGSVAPGKIGGHRRPLLESYEESLRELTMARKGITLAELRTAIVERGGPTVSLWTVWSMLRRIGLSHKESR
jgi:putative transposase